MNGIIQKFGDSESDTNLSLDNFLKGLVGSKNGQSLTNVYGWQYPVGSKVLCALSDSYTIYEITSSGLSTIKAVVGSSKVRFTGEGSTTVYCWSGNDLNDFAMIIFSK